MKWKKRRMIMGGKISFTSLNTAVPNAEQKDDESLQIQIIFALIFLWLLSF